MKTIRKTVVILLALAMLLSLSACGRFETRMARSVQKMSKVQSMRMDVDVDVTMGMTLMGETLDMDAQLSAKADVMLDPVKLGGSMTAKVMDEEQETLFYAQKGEDEGYDVFLSMDGGRVWTRQSVEGAEAPSLSSTEKIGALLKLASTFEERGTESVRGSAATVYTGVISGEDIGVALNATGVLDALSESLDDIDLSGVDFSHLSDIPATVAIDNKSDMLVRYTMDMTALMQDLIELVMDVLVEQITDGAGLGSIDLSALGLKLEIENAQAVIELYDFDAVESVDIPQSALAA
ncbi:MAG: hypothetical protein IJ594_00915 [Oscillospiraceae bacterium]|nr:hypothetical protein [Oscillospiraceae bacterium]